MNSTSMLHWIFTKNALIGLAAIACGSIGGHAMSNPGFANAAVSNAAPANAAVSNAALSNAPAATTFGDPVDDSSSIEFESTASIRFGEHSESSRADSDTLSLDALWSEIRRAVAQGDFEAYAATFHPDAVLVNGIREMSYPIADALAGWRQGFDDTRAGRMTASVDFRFSERLVSDQTAHETGIFRYASGPGGVDPEVDAGVESDPAFDVAYIHFQALSVRLEGRWRTLMEYQIGMASEQEWESIGRP